MLQLPMSDRLLVASLCDFPTFQLFNLPTVGGEYSAPLKAVKGRRRHHRAESLRGSAGRGALREAMNRKVGDHIIFGLVLMSFCSPMHHENAVLRCSCAISWRQCRPRQRKTLQLQDPEHGGMTCCGYGIRHRRKTGRPHFLNRVTLEAALESTR